MEATWEREYYRQLKRDARKKILEEAIAAEGMSPANELRQKLLEARYGKKLSDGNAVDYFVRGWMTLCYLNNSSSSVFGRKKRERDIQSLRDDWQFALMKEYGEIGKKVLYQEMRNLVLLYIDLCKNDKNYGAILLGIGRMKEGTLLTKIGKDLFAIAYEVPRSIGIEDELREFTKAVTDVFCEEYPDRADEFRGSIARLEQQT